MGVIAPKASFFQLEEKKGFNQCPKRAKMEKSVSIVASFFIYPLFYPKLRGQIISQPPYFI